MKKRKGYISIIGLIVICVSSIMILKIIFLNSQQNHIMHSRGNSIQSYYLSEGKILMSLYDRDYYNNQLYPALLNVFRKHNFATKSERVIIDKSDLGKYDSISDVKLSFGEKENRKEMILMTGSDYKGISTSVKSSVSLVNELFETGNGILSIDSMEEKYKDDLEKLLANIEENIAVKDNDNSEVLYANEVSDYPMITLKLDDNWDNKLISTRETMEYPYVEGFNKREVFLIVKNSQGDRPNFHIDCGRKSRRLSGIIYVEGDMEISGEFTFNGILIVNGGEIRVKSGVKPKVNGMIILYDGENISKVNEKIELMYYDYTVYKYGTFLPGFLDININSIKNGKADIY